MVKESRGAIDSKRLELQGVDVERVEEDVEIREERLCEVPLQT